MPQYPAVDLVAIHPDQQQILVDQSGSAIRMPSVDIPVPLLVGDQTILTRLSTLIQRQYDLVGTVVAITPGLHDSNSSHELIAVFMTDNAGTSSTLDQKGLRWREVATLQELYDHQSSARVQATLNLVRARHLSSDLQDAWSSKVDRAITFLREKMVEKDGLVGWTQFLTGDSVGVVSTAQGALTFLEVGQPDHNTSRNIEALRACQNPDGGWPVRRALIGKSDRSITESTIYVLWVLTRAGIDPRETPTLEGIEWLENAQLDDGGWGSTSMAAKARTYPTAFAIRYLSSVNSSATVVRKAITWLQETQNPNGGWAASPKDTTTTPASTPVHTAHALMALLAAGTSRDSPQVLSGIRYLKSTTNVTAEEPWSSTSEVEQVEGDAALDFRHFTTPWVLCALLQAGVPIGDPVVMNAIQWIVTAQHSLGYWSSPLTPGQTPIWATFDAMFALSQVRLAALERFSELIDADARSAELDLAWKSYFSVLDEIQEKAAGERFRRSRWIYAWNSILTFAVIMILLFGGNLHTVRLSPVTKIVGAALIGLVPGFAPFLYQLLLEAIKTRRRGSVS
jgi:Squalene-hopene cyclase C-terminal domain/Prenyltransferase and squalene oxidase repeat